MKPEPLKKNTICMSCYREYNNSTIESAFQWLDKQDLCAIDLFKLGEIEFWDLEFLLKRNKIKAFEDVIKI